MNTTQIFDKVENGVIVKQSIRRGTNWLGKLSDDSVYLAKGLYPVVGTKPVITDSQTISGPVHVFDEANNVVNLVWTVSEIPIQTLRENGCKAITAHRKSKYSGVMPITISSGTFNYPYNELFAMQHFNRYQAITASLITCPAYWRDEDNNDNAVVVGDFAIMSAAMAAYIEAFALRSHTDKVAIETASKSEIDDIVNAYLAYDPSA